MIKQLLLACPFALMPLLANAVCPDHKMTLCEIVQANEWVLRTTVESTQYIKDENDPEGIAGWLYQLNVKTDYRGKKLEQLSVLSKNTTSRVNLETGKEYFVFVSKNPGQVPETTNYCDDFTESQFSEDLEKKIQDCVINEKH